MPDIFRQQKNKIMMQPHSLAIGMEFISNENEIMSHLNSRFILIHPAPRALGAQGEYV
jgi:hypothetical protein